MKTISLVLLLCLVVLQACGQDFIVDGNIEFLPPATDLEGLDKDSPTLGPGEIQPTTTPDPDKLFGNEKPTTSQVISREMSTPPEPDKDGAETASGGGQVDLVPATTAAPPSKTPVQTTTPKAVVSSENCTNVKCTLDVVSNCSHPVVLPGRCCPSCPNLTVCSDVHCPCGSVCSEHNGHAICCKKHADSYYSHNTHRRLRKAFVAVNKYGDNCTLRYECHQFVRVCNKGNCTQSEVCYPSSESVATCCPRQMGRKPICYVTHPKLLGRCQAPPVGEPEERNCTCRRIMSLQRGYHFRRENVGHGGHNRHRRSYFLRGHHQEHPSCQRMTVVHFRYNILTRGTDVIACTGSVNKCSAMFGVRRRSRSYSSSSGHRRHRRSPYHFSHLLNSFYRSFFFSRPSRIMCRRVRV